MINIYNPLTNQTTHSASWECWCNVFNYYLFFVVVASLGDPEKNLDDGKILGQLAVVQSPSVIGKCRTYLMFSLE